MSRRRLPKRRKPTMVELGLSSVGPCNKCGKFRIYSLPDTTWDSSWVDPVKPTKCHCGGDYE